MLMFNIKDPRVTLVNITAVKVSKDIGTAKIYFTVTGDESDRREAEVGLRKAAAFIRRELGQIMRLRFVPQLRFVYDESVAYGRKIDELLRQVKDDLDDPSTDS